MADKFIAIRVPEGDAFYLHREYEKRDIRILVDGGGGYSSKKWKYFNSPRSTFTPIFSKAVVNQRKSGHDLIDVVVATHNDADHPSGLIELIKDNIPITELWVPALFGNVAIQMMESLYNTFDNIINYILENLPEEVKTIEEALNFFQKEMENPENIHKHREEANKETQYIKNGPDRVNEYIEEVTVDQLRRGLRWNPESQLPLGEYIHVRGFNWTSDGQAAVVEGFLELANNIAKLCQMAAKNDISIRYFEYTDDQALKKSGGEAWLKPLNSKEITSIVKIYQPIVMLLTRTNRESLVFLSKHIEDHPAVLFSADSNFDFGLPPVTDGMIITAPHHGSSSNNRLAVELAKLNTYQFLWIRSDGRLSSISKSQGANWSRPASWYTALADVHACTHCNDATVIQNVHAKVISGRWKLYSATKKCRCT